MREAITLTGHRTQKAFCVWVKSHNAKHPQALILHRHGAVDVETLDAAIKYISSPAENDGAVRK